MRVQDMMSKDVITVQQQDDLLRVYDLMTANQIRHLPVLDAHDLAGIITQRDLFKACMPSILGIGEIGQKLWGHTIQVKDIMSPLMITISPETPIREAADIIIQQGIGCLPVMSGSRIIGIVTKTDLLRKPYARESKQTVKEEQPDRLVLKELIQYRAHDRLNVLERWKLNASQKGW